MRPASLCLVALLVPIGCTDVLVGPDPGSDARSLFDVVWRDFDRNYAMFGAKDIDWLDVRSRYRPDADTASTPASAAGIIGAMLTELRDVHVDLFVPPNRFYHSREPGETWFSDLTVFSRYVSNGDATPGGRIRYGTIGDLGYVWIPGFGGSGWAGQIDDVLASLGDIQGLIIDVRDNGGGNSGNAQTIASRFVDQERVFAYIRYRSGPAHDDLTDFIPVRVAPEGRSFRGRVVVLTNRRAVSAAEHFVLAMRTQPGVVFVGDTTGGGFGNPMIRELPNGWLYRLPQWIEYGADTTLYEEVGIPPDIVVPMTEADALSGFDRQLVRAIEIAGG